MSLYRLNMGEVSAIRQWLESTKQSGMSLHLSTTFAMLNELNLELNGTTIIHVAGSNGKGTLCSLMATALSLNSDSNILFTSPHLCRVEERIRWNGRPLDATTFDEALMMVEQVSSKLSLNPTFFETTFLAAMVVVSMYQPKFLILETGLGGRLDATRCAPADLSILTSITTEHTDILGDNIYQIIKEKAAIARPGKILIARKMPISGYEDFVTQCAANCAQQELNETPLDTDCTFVEINDGVTVLDEACALAREAFMALSISVRRLDEAKILVNWPARQQQFHLPQGHKIILDAAHNPTGLDRVKNQLIELAKSENSEDRLSLIFGTSPQVELDVMLKLVHDICGHFSAVTLYLTKPQGGRYPGVEPSMLAEYEWKGCSVKIVNNYRDVIDMLSNITPHDAGPILSIGSLYLQGNILNYLGKNTDEDLSLLPKQ